MSKRRAKGRKVRAQKSAGLYGREKVPGAALLLAFLEKHSINYRDAAGALGVKHPAVWQWAHGITIPREERYREAIAIWTDGKVPASSWLRKSEQKPIDVQPYRANGTEG